MKTRKPKTERILTEKQLLQWIWQALKVGKDVPYPDGFGDLTWDHYNVLNDRTSDNIPICWSRVSIARTAFPVRSDLWTQNEKSVLHDLLEVSQAGVLVCSDTTAGLGPASLMVLFKESDDLNACDAEVFSDYPPLIVVPRWGVSCSQLNLMVNTDDA